MRGRFQALVLPAVQLGMQACWLYAWLSLLEAKLLDRIVIAPVVLLFLIAAAPVRSYFGRLPLKAALRVACFWMLWVLFAALAGKMLLYPAMAWGQFDWFVALPRALVRLIFETQPAELLLLLGSGCAWYLGGRTVSGPTTHANLLGNFQFGLVLLFTAFLLAQGLEVPAGHPVLLSLAFFALSLTGIAVTRSRQSSERASVPANRHFTGSLLTLLLMVALLGLLAGITITPDLVGTLLDAGRVVLGALRTALLFILSLIPTPDIPAGADMEPPATGDDSSLIEFYRTLPWPATLRRVLFIFWVIIVMGMFLFALWRVCTMVLEWLKQRGNSSGVEIESLDSGLLADLLALLSWVDRTARRAANRILGFLRSRLGVTSEPTWTSVYAGLVRWAAKKMRPREPFQSAHEYQAVLSEWLPSATPDLALVTETYARARYGGLEPDSAQVQAMQNAVARIRRSPRRPREALTNTPIEGAE